MRSNFLLFIAATLLAFSPAAFAKDDDSSEGKGSEKKARIIVVDEGQCQDAIRDTQTACNSTDMTVGLSAAQQAQALTLQTQANQNNQNVATAGANQAAQCKNQALMSSVMAGLSALKGGACMFTVSSCKSECEHDLDQLKVILAKADDADKAMVLEKIKKKQNQISQCNAMAPNAGMAMAQAALMVGAMLMNNQCAQQNLAAGATPIANDCSNPEVAKVSILCICQADPKNRMCTPTPALPQSTATTNGDFGPATPGYSAGPVANDGSQVLAGGGKPNTASGSNVGGAGAGGGGPQASGGAPLAAGPQGGDGGSRSDVDKNVITGQTGGAGGRGTGGLSASGGGGSSGGGGRAPSNAPAFDLSKFLPKGATALRSGRLPPGQDGITSSMGPSLWEKVSVRYQSHRSNMIQDK